MSTEVDELKERIEELNCEVEELEQSLEEAEQHDDRFDDGYDKAMLEMGKKIEHAFYSGFDSCSRRKTHKTKLQLFLDYQMEQRL